MSTWLRTNMGDSENGFWWVWVLKGERRGETQEGSWEPSLWKTHLDFIHQNGTVTPTVLLQWGPTVMNVQCESSFVFWVQFGLQRMGSGSGFLT